jgi:hypothetical protein
MTTKTDFDAAEWETILEGPVIAGLILVTAQRGGAVRESMAIAKAYVEAGREHTGDLLGEITAKAHRISAKEFSSKEALRTEGLEKIRQAVSTLEAKATPEEVDAYKRFVLSVAEHAAAADKSGGPLGVGGVEVSDAESAALDELAATLGIQRS